MKSSSIPRALLLALVACGSEASVVGGECKPGLVPYGHTCVDPAIIGGSTPPPGNDVVVGGQTNPAPSATSPTTPPSQPSSKDPDQVIPKDPDIPPAVVPPPVDPPPVVDPPPQLVCTPPLVACRGACISVSDDPDNCGACGKVCGSGICVAGACVGATPGDVVLIGHDYSSVRPSTPAAKVLLNAVQIATTDPIRVLSWEGNSSSPAIANVKSLLTSGVWGRKLAFESASDAVLQSTSLDLSYDVLILYDAAGASPAALGAGWMSALDAFTHRGGIVIALDGGATAMPVLLTNAGLLTVGAHSQLAQNARLEVAVPGDAVGAALLSPYAYAKTMSFQGVVEHGADTAWVVLDQTSQAPVVVHRVVR